MKNKINLVFVMIFLLVVMIGLISAAGVTCDYWEGRPLEMHYGETKIVNLNLQNMVGDEDITVRVIVKQGSDIAILENDIYTAKSGTYDTVIPVTITIPKNYDKTNQKIEFYTETVSKNEGGMVSLGMGWTTSFDVILSEKPPREINYLWPITFLIISIIIILFIILKIRKTKRVIKSRKGLKKRKS